ncbi:hypothetical protein [Corynebacterium pilosum]|uniref:Flavohemoprotein n=1 Tax=Corynebacterium pilosum TaxID=35756 RepID=A0A376CKB8_9CORY|nr:hypothetical protein [Corynebacterium pilosum]STC68941.1 Flavohemoprotein [Corynebacterium pilosum]
MDTLADVGQLIRERGSDLNRILHQRLFEAIPEARNLFREDLTGAHVDLPRALGWVLERSLIDEPLSLELTARIQGMGVDHRRHGFPSETYDLFGLLLGDAIAETIGDDLPAARVDAAMTVVGRICSEMSAGAAEADAQGVPPANAAQVTAVEHAADGVNVIQLEAGMPVDYEAGQQVPVMPMQRRGEWLNLAPAVPPNRFGQLELHVPDDIPVEQGEYWTLGAARGDVSLDPARDALLVGVGRGVAAVKALVFNLLEQAERPKVHAVLAAERSTQLYEVGTFAALATTQDWLTVTPVVESVDSVDFVDAESKDARAAELTPVALPVTLVVSGVGMFWGRQIILCGPEEATTAIKDALLKAGAEEADIQLVTPTGPDQWPTPEQP